MSEIFRNKLSDQIISDGARIATFGGPKIAATNSIESAFREGVRRGPVFHIQEVYDYFTANKQTTQFRILDLPCIAPPFPNFFMEFGLNPLERTKLEYARAGVLFQAFSTQEYRALNPLLPAVPLDARWILRGTSVIDPTATPRDLAIMSMSDIPVKEDGTITGDKVMGQSLLGYKDGNPNITPELMQDYLRGTRGAIFFPALLAITFTHAKGTRIREEEPPIKLSRKHEKRTGHPLVKYHTIEINPMREILLKEGEIETEGRQMASHLVRGHFADYRERGLFGRNKGIFWFPDHVRGTEEAGQVIKDYKVNTP